MSSKKQSLRAKGFTVNEVSPSRVMLMAHTDLWVAPEGHPCFDRRSLDPVDEDLAKDMADRVLKGLTPNTNAIKVQERKVEGRDVLLVVDGHGREQALRRAYEDLVSSGKRSEGDALMPLCEFFSGTDKELLLERARSNKHDEFARVDSTSTLAFRVRQFASSGGSDSEFVEGVQLKDVTIKVVEALHRFGDLDETLRVRFDTKEIPIGFLPAIVDEEPEKRLTLVEKLLASGVKTQRGATRKLNREKKDCDSVRVKLTPKRAERIATAIMSVIRPSGDGEEKARELTAEEYRALGFAEALLACSGKDLPDLPQIVKDALDAGGAS